MACRLLGTSEISIRTHKFSYKKNACENVVCKRAAILSRPHLIKAICYDDVIKWRRFPRYCPFVRGIHRAPVNSPHKGQWRGALIFSLTCAWINGWVNNREAGDWRRHYAHYDVTIMVWDLWWLSNQPVPGQRCRSGGRLERTCRCTQLCLSRNHLSGHLGPTGKWRGALLLTC